MYTTIEEYRGHLEDMKTPDDNAIAIIWGMLNLSNKGQYDFQNLINQFHDNEEILKRLYKLSSDTRHVTPKWFIETALLNLKELQAERLKEKYGDIPDKI